ncbi:phage portal protein [Roseomonas elaeocarpi]|uniref:Phage portal protein n=1 Tax=Roseomonas elaeocarpi TaxID=907779 RepID=A0ABV6JQC5_9PROT
MNPLTAMQAAAVYGCVKRLSEDIGKLPLRLKRRLRRGGFSLDLDHPLNRLFRRPNEWQTPSQCWSYFVWALALRGNAYAPVLRGPAGEPVQIIPVNPDQVSPLRATDGLPWWQVSHPCIGDGRRFDQGNLLHAHGMSFDGYTGVSPIMLAQDVVGLSLATQQHGATLFRQGAQVSGVLETAGKLSAEAAQRMGASWMAAYGGVQNSHKVVVLEEGTKFSKIAMTNDEAQFLATRQFSVVEICRMFGVPPHKVFDLSNAHYANIENSEQQYINDTLIPVAQQIEEVMEAVLLFEDEQGQFEIEFNFDKLLRGDRKTRMETYVAGVNNGIMSRNQARIEEGWEPVDGGDELRVPLNTGAPEAAPVPAPKPESAQTETQEP